MKRAHFAAALLGFALAAPALALEANAASRAELESLKGVGTGLSQKLVDARQARAFVDWADLMKRVPGVRAATAARLSAGGLTVAGAPYSPQPESTAVVTGARAASASASSPR